MPKTLHSGGSSSSSSILLYVRREQTEVQETTSFTFSLTQRLSSEEESIWGELQSAELVKERIVSLPQSHELSHELSPLAVRTRQSKINGAE